jgi:hypothetical protein
MQGYNILSFAGEGDTLHFAKLHKKRQMQEI